MYKNYGTLGNIKALLCMSENFNPRRIEFELIEGTNVYDVKMYTTIIADGEEIEAVISTKSKFPSDYSVVIDNNTKDKEVFSIIIPE